MGSSSVWWLEAQALEPDWVQSLLLPFISCVTLRHGINLFMPQFSHLKNEANNGAYLIRLLNGLHY